MTKNYRLRTPNFELRTLLKPLQWIYCCYALILFVAIMLLVFPFVFIASFFGVLQGGNLIYRICIVWGDLWFPLVFIFHRNIFEEREYDQQQYIFVLNHISYLDAALIFKTIRRPVRPLGKVETSKVPVFGFIYRNTIITVDRGDIKNRLKSIRRLMAVLRSGISILFFPEGGFNMTGEPLKRFYDGAFRIAIETQTPVKPVLFLDTYDRLNYRNLFSLTPGRSRAVHLKQISVEGLTVKDVDILKQKVFDLMENKLREYKVSWIVSRES